MPRRGQRIKVEPNIWRDETGFAVVVKIAGEQKETRFPPGTTLLELQEERDRQKQKAKEAERPRAGTLAADVVEHLKTIVEEEKRKRAAIRCRHWVLTGVEHDNQATTYGRLSRFALTKLRIEQVLTAWQRADVSASECNKRLCELRGVFRTVNTDNQDNPALRVKKRKEPDPQPRAIDYALITRILAAMPDRGKPGRGKGSTPKVSLAKLRCAVMAYTGLPPAQMIRINPATDLMTHTLLVESSTGAPATERVPVLRARPRRKGKGTQESWIQLTPQGLDALEQLIAANGLRKFSTSSVRASWHRGCAKVILQQLAAGEAPLPHRIRIVQDKPVIAPLVRPYDLRHSYLTAALRASKGNLVGVQHLGQHADIRQTRRYIEAAVPAEASAVANAVQSFLPRVAVPKHTKAKGLAPTK